MKLNNKGMAIAGSLYAILILFVSLLTALLILISNSTNLLNKTKGDIITSLDGERSIVLNAGKKLCDYGSVVSAGAGLYKDGEMYRYKSAGEQPDNYVYFDDELWRILAIDGNDGQLKIIKAEPIDKVFDEANNRTTTDNPQCTNSETGCNVWATIETDQEERNVSTEFDNDSSLFEYAQNTYYYNYLSTKAQNLIAEGNWYFDSFNGSGVLNENTSIVANVGLLNINEYVNATTLEGCDASSFINNQSSCLNWLNSAPTWVLNNSGSIEDSGECYYINADDQNINSKVSNCNDSSLALFRPVVYLKKDIRITSGDGTSTDPYIIELIP